MAALLTAKKAEERARSRIADIAADVWTSAELMTVLDEALEAIWSAIRLKGADRLTDRLDLTSASFTLESNNRYTWTPPESVGPIRMVEVFSGSSRPLQVVQAGFEIKEYGQRSWSGSALTWNRSHSGSLTILGDMSRYGTIRIWYIRRFPPMHYGVTSALGTTATMAFASAPTGRVLKRDLYDGTDVEFTAGTLLDTVVRITDYATATTVATFSPAVGAPVAASQEYSLIVPVSPEHGEYVIEEMAARLLERAGNVNYIMAKDGRLARLREEFLRDVMHRDQDAPPTLYSHR